MGVVAWAGGVVTVVGVGVVVVVDVVELEEVLGVVVLVDVLELVEVLEEGVLGEVAEGSALWVVEGTAFPPRVGGVLAGVGTGVLEGVHPAPRRTRGARRSESFRIRFCDKEKREEKKYSKPMRRYKFFYPRLFCTSRV